MNGRIALLTALALLAGAAASAKAGPVGSGYSGDGSGGNYSPGGPDPYFTFTYSNGGTVAYGTLTAVASGVGDDSLWATGGTLVVTSSSDGNASVGTYSLLNIGPAPTISPSGMFSVDNLIYAADDAGNGVFNGIGPYYATIDNNSFLDNGGLLFGQPGTGSQTEINIFGVGDGNYAFYSEANGSYNIQQASGGTSTFVDPPGAPEPASLTLLGIGIAALVGYGWRRRKLAAV